MKNILIFIILIASTTETFANDKYNLLFTRQELLHHVYKDRYLELTDVNKREAIQTWFREFGKVDANWHAYGRIMDRTKDIVRGKDYRQLIYYFTVTGQSKKASEVLGLYIISAHALLENFGSNPQSTLWNTDLAGRVNKFLKRFDYESIQDIEACYYNYIKSDFGFNIFKSGKMAVALQNCVFYNNEVNYLNVLLEELFIKNKFYGAPFPVSFMGHIGGNSVEVLNAVPMALVDIENLGFQLNLALTAVHEESGKLYSQMSVEDFKSIMTSPQAAARKLFSIKEGFKTAVQHNTFRSGIYGEIIESIQNAQESVFIDMFWMGGSLGINLAKELFKKVNKNPNFSVFIITDAENKFQYAPELDFVYNYMRAFSEKFTDKNFYIVPASIGLKRTALPEFFDLLITDKVIDDANNNTGLRSFLEKDGFHLLAKSDHTKVFVIDGKNPETGTAFVGSKNWTDSSGGMNYDEVAKIQGPATALILNSFYYDTTEALLKDHQDGGSLLLMHLNRKYPNINWDKGIATDKKENKLKKGIQLLLKDMDVIERHSFNEFSPFEIDLPFVKKGESVVSPAQNNIYGTEMSAIEQNIQAILGAKRQIIVDDQFLYDPSVVEALKVAKIQNKVDVYILLETLKPLGSESNSAAHIPNNLFVNELFQLGIPVKWKITPPDVTKNILNETEKYRIGEQTPVVLATTFHVKSLSVDGLSAQQAKDFCSTNAQEDFAPGSQLALQLNTTDETPILITGSANKDIMTMSGGFREYQIATFDEMSVIQHDCIFWKRWINENESIATDGLSDFEIPEHIQELNIKDKKAFLSVLRMLFFAPYNFTKDYFN